MVVLYVFTSWRDVPVVYLTLNVFFSIVAPTLFRLLVMSLPHNKGMVQDYLVRCHTPMSMAMLAMM